jgi:hypothetical protein
MTNLKNAKIYRITNTIDKSVFIGGTTVPLTKRANVHFQQLRMNKVHSDPLYNAMSKHGFSKFEFKLVKNFPCKLRDQLNREIANIVKSLESKGVVTYNSMKPIQVKAGCSGKTKSMAKVNAIEFEKQKHELKFKAPIGYRRCFTNISDDCLGTAEEYNPKTGQLQWRGKICRPCTLRDQYLRHTKRLEMAGKVRVGRGNRSSKNTSDDD